MYGDMFKEAGLPPIGGRLPYRVCPPSDFYHLTLRAMFYDHLTQFFNANDLPLTSEGLPDLSDVIHLDDDQKTNLENMALGIKIIPLSPPKPIIDSVPLLNINHPVYLLTE